MRYIYAILFLASATIVAGCGTVFHNKPNVEIIGPQGALVEDMNGDQLPRSSDELGYGIYPDRFKTDSIKIVYENKSTTIALVKRLDGLEFVNLFTLGVGFVLDDLTNTWFSYAPVHVTIDYDIGGVQGIKATTANMFGEQLGFRRPQLLLLGGGGVSFQMNGGGSVFPFGNTQFPFPVASLQGGFGIDLYKQFELFYLTRYEPYYSITNQTNGETGSITAQDICLRYFFSKSYFVQCSLGRATLSDNDYNEDEFVDDVYGYEYDIPSSQYNDSFNEVGAAVGWAGDLSYVALQYFGGLTSFSLPEYNDIRYHTIYLTFGLNFRL